jgi:hypothetical protein
VRAPVLVPSFFWCGIEFEVSVGDTVSWQLAVTDDIWAPEHLLATVEVEAESLGDYPMVPGYHPYIVRRGSFVAWWDAHRPLSGPVTFKELCHLEDSRLPEDMPAATGTVTQMYWALDQWPSEPTQAFVPGMGLVEVPSTDYRPDQPGFKAHFPPGGIPEQPSWRHLGWIAMVEFEEADWLPS